MKDSITFRVDSEKKKNILRAAESLHLSMSEYIEKALDNEGTRKDKKEAIPQLIEIRNKFESTCDECGRTMKREEFILWSKGVAICSDCGINASSNKHCWNAQRKEREIVKALEEARERLNIANLEMDEKEALKKSIKRLEKIYENQCELHKENMEFLRVALGTSREKEVIEKVNNIADDLIPLVADLKQERESKLRRKVKPKKAKKKKEAE